MRAINITLPLCAVALALSSCATDESGDFTAPEPRPDPEVPVDRGVSPSVDTGQDLQIDYIALNAATQSYDFETGAQGWTVAGDPSTSIGYPSIPPTWSLGTSLPGTVGQALPSTWWTNPNYGQMGAERSHVTSPILHASGSSVSITFDSYSSNEPGYPTRYDVEHVQISINGGSFTDVHGYTWLLHNAYDRTFRNITFTSSTGIAAGDQIRYRFLYDTGDGCCGWHSVHAWAFDNVFVAGASEIIPIYIDIKPGGDPNSINLGAKGVIPVAILTTAVADGDASDFDAADVDATSVTLGDDDGNDTPVKAKKKGSLFASLEDVDGDGDDDLSLKFDQPALEANGDLDASTTELILNGATFGGQAIQGSDAVRITPASS